MLSHKQIVAAVWGAEANVETQFVRVLVGNLRQKIEKDPARPTLIVTEPAVGYRLTGKTVSSTGRGLASGHGAGEAAATDAGERAASKLSKC